MVYTKCVQLFLIYISIILKAFDSVSHRLLLQTEISHKMGSMMDWEQLLMFAAHVLHEAVGAILTTFITPRASTQALYSWLHFTVSQKFMLDMFLFTALNAHNFNSGPHKVCVENRVNYVLLKD